MENTPTKCAEAFNAMVKAVVKGMRNDHIMDGALNLVAFCIFQRHRNVTPEKAEEVYRATCRDLRLFLVNNGYPPGDSVAKN